MPTGGLEQPNGYTIIKMKNEITAKDTIVNVQCTLLVQLNPVNPLTNRRHESARNNEVAT